MRRCAICFGGRWSQPNSKAVDAVVFDPPRQGAEAQARELAEALSGSWSRYRAIRRHSARDVRILVDGGYRLIAVTPVDQFRYSAHVEIVGVLERG